VPLPRAARGPRHDVGEPDGARSPSTTRGPYGTVWNSVLVLPCPAGAMGNLLNPRNDEARFRGLWAVLLTISIRPGIRDEAPDSCVVCLVSVPDHD